MQISVTGFFADETIRLALDVADLRADETITDIVSLDKPAALKIRETGRDIVASGSGEADRAVSYWLDPTEAGVYTARWTLGTSDGERIGLTVVYRIQSPPAIAS